MSYDTQYRPTTFADVVGQKDTVDVLQELLRRGEVFQKSYVFAGPSGTGKTTTARILARAMLCPNVSEALEPCNSCTSCTEIITRGSSFAFTEMDAANNTGADNVRKIIEGLEYFTLDGGDRKIYLIDECFTEDTEILTDEGLKTIRDIVEAKFSGKVLSFDIEAGQEVWKSVTDWFDIPDKREVLRLSFDNGAELTVTLDQDIYTNNRGWVKAKDLQEDDDVCETSIKNAVLPVDGVGRTYCACGCGETLIPKDARNRPRLFKKAHSHKLSQSKKVDQVARDLEWEEKADAWNESPPSCRCGCGTLLYRTAQQLRNCRRAIQYTTGHKQRKSHIHSFTCRELEVIYGTLLGDTSITRPHPTSYPRLAFTHSRDQKAYAHHKVQELSRMCWYTQDAKSLGYVKGGLITRGSTSTLRCLEAVWNVTRPSGPKSITQAWLDALTLRSLAYWYMDDGSIARSLHTGEVSRITLHTEGFPLDENQMLADFLSDLGYPTRVSVSRGYYYLYLARESASRFIVDIDPFIPESMLYKSARG